MTNQILLKSDYKPGTGKQNEERHLQYMHVVSEQDLWGITVVCMHVYVCMVNSDKARVWGCLSKDHLSA